MLITFFPIHSSTFSLLTFEADQCAVPMVPFMCSYFLLLLHFLSIEIWPFYIVKSTLLMKWSSDYNFEMQTFGINTSQNWKILLRLFIVCINVSEIDAKSISFMTPLQTIVCCQLFQKFPLKWSRKTNIP